MAITVDAALFSGHCILKSILENTLSCLSAERERGPGVTEARFGTTALALAFKVVLRELRLLGVSIFLVDSDRHLTFSFDVEMSGPDLVKKVLL